jgi:hypothetical protein
MRYIFTILIVLCVSSAKAEQTLEEQVRLLEQMDKYAGEAFEKTFKYSLEGVFPGYLADD